MPTSTQRIELDVLSEQVCQYYLKGYEYLQGILRTAESS
jgi:hypothetical protein